MLWTVGDGTGTDRAAARATGRGAMADRDIKDELAQLRQGLDEVRGSVASLVARFGEDAADAGGRGLQQARRAAGEVARNVAGQAGDGVTALRGGIEGQPLASIAVAFLVGLSLGTLLAAGFGSRR
jgi:ElaB/YqjD/DUF883 family membrane-anchored ribosome-binding protein